MARILVAAAFGFAAVVAAVVLYGGVAIWLFTRDLPPDSDGGWAIGFDVASFMRPSWTWLFAGVIFAAVFVVTYRRVK